MRNLLQFAVGIGMFSLSLHAATITFTESTVGVNAGGQTVFRYVYDLTGVPLLANQEVDFRFSPTLYGTLSNGVAPGAFSVALFQPDNPPGAFGDYSAFTTAAIPAPSGIFSVDFTFKGSGTPGSQPFFINQFDQFGVFQSVAASGFTTAAGSNTPEPATWFPAVAGLLFFTGIARSARRRSMSSDL